MEAAVKENGFGSPVFYVMYGSRLLILIAFNVGSKRQVEQVAGIGQSMQMIAPWPANTVYATVITWCKYFEPTLEFQPFVAT